ncbi:efflux RND transporter periplasmic adaptor subunit [Pseudonocardia acaciae]|uniref:efflux RND transporter periplasmic adaptor subunit n=1 Tax=Pseudonocardia acaciae TaxID=551276 RepID=UPI000686DFBE|nr:efflux RND transporter periplasmic adaptor subunit [Pseudonocardia acaciae]
MTSQDPTPEGAPEQPTNGAVATLERPRPSDPPPAPPKRRLKRSTKIATAIITLITLLEAGAFAGTYFLHSSKYVSTDNAKVDGDKVDINAPSTGTLIDWKVTQGSSVQHNEVVGRIEEAGSGARVKRSIRSPGSGTVAVNNTVEGQYVTQGSKLATAYNPDSIYITARVEESEISEVRVGQQVDITVDAFPNTPILGLVTQIQGSTAGAFELFPSSDSDPRNPQKVDQYVPVRIAIINNNGVTVVPGMNVDASIHKDH